VKAMEDNAHWYKKDAPGCKRSDDNAALFSIEHTQTMTREQFVKEFPTTGIPKSKTEVRIQVSQSIISQ